MLLHSANIVPTAASLNLVSHGLRFTAGGIGAVESAAGGLLLLGVGTGSKAMTTYIPGVGLVVAPAMLAGEGGLAAVRWQLGYISDAEFGRSMKRLGVQAGGLTVGAAAGGVIGSVFFGIGALPGAAIGGAIGHGLASVGVWAFDWWQPETPAVGLVGTMTAEEREAYLDYVLRKYGDTSK